MPDIFISYSQKDKKWVGHFASTLESLGYDIWWDTELITGQSWSPEIHKQLDSAKCVITVWSQNSATRPWVQAESTEAMQRGILVPIRIDNVRIPMPFNTLQTGDFATWKGDVNSAEFQKLIIAISQYTKPSKFVHNPPPKPPSTSEQEKAAPKPPKQQTNPPVKPKNPLRTAMVLAGLVGVGSAGYTLVQVPLPLPEMVTIPAGTFTMGCVKGRDLVADMKECPDEEKPSRKVKVAAFQLAKTEVTNKQYVAFLNEKGRSKDSAKPWFETKAEDSRSQIIMKDNTFHVEKDFENYPVVNVSWYGASAYVDWLKEKTGKAYRLPSEAEWEYAARAGSETAYSWGNKIGKNKANCDGCGSQWDDKSPAPVASFSANAYGLYDIHGNVWEWVQDRWHADYQGAPSTASPWQTGKSSGRVLHGGSWVNSPQVLRSANRNYYSPDSRSNYLGFRPALGL